MIITPAIINACFQNSVANIFPPFIRILFFYDIIGHDDSGDGHDRHMDPSPAVFSGFSVEVTTGNVA